MAGRGRGGRGRGRGAVPPSVAQSMYSNFGDRQQQRPLDAQASRPESGQKSPNALIPDPPNMASFTEEELWAAEYADQLDRKMRSSVFFRPLRCAQYKIDRYSDRYLGAHVIGDAKLDRISSINTSPAFLPEELHALAGFGEAKGRSKGAKTAQTSSRPVFDEKTLLTLDVMAKTEESGALRSSEEEADDNDDETGAGSEDASFGEEDFEDDTDYNLSYFDNGEDYGGGGGDYDEGGDNEAVF